jgi:hypothetical protein
MCHRAYDMHMEGMHMEGKQMGLIYAEVAVRD